MRMRYVVYDCSLESSAAVKRLRSDCPGNVPQSDNVSGNAALRRPPTERLLRQRAQYQLRVTERCATESATEREARLARRRVRDRARRASDSHSNRWDSRLQHCGAVNSTGFLLSPQKRERGPSLTTAGQSTTEDCFGVDTKEREARLQQVRVCQQQRSISESTEEREAHLQQVRVCQQQRSAEVSTDGHYLRFLNDTFVSLLHIFVPLQLHSIRMCQILPLAHARPTMPCIVSRAIRIFCARIKLCAHKITGRVFSLPRIILRAQKFCARRKYVWPARLCPAFVLAPRVCTLVPFIIYAQSNVFWTYK